MRFTTEYIFWAKRFIDLREEVQEIYSAMSSVDWSQDKVIAVSRAGKAIAWQEAYDRLFGLIFEGIGEWQSSRVLREKPKHKGDFLKNGPLVEVQFDNSATVYRDCYKSHYGFANKSLTLAVLVLPTNPVKFYEKLPDEDRSLLPFTPIYFLAQKE